MSLAVKTHTISDKLQSYLFQFPQKYNIDIHQCLFINSKVFLVYRLVVFIVLSGRYMLEMYTMLASEFDLVQYLTNVGFFLTWLHFALVLQHYLLKPYFASRRVGKLQDWVNLIFQMAICTQIPVTLLFWLVLYDYTAQTNAIKVLKEIGVHGFPLICLSIDFCFNLYQFPARHFLCVIVMSLLYLCINVSYSLTIQPVYPPLDWVSLICYVYLGGCFTVVMFAHFAFRRIWMKYKKNRIIQKDQEVNKNNSLIEQLTKTQLV